MKKEQGVFLWSALPALLLASSFMISGVDQAITTGAALITFSILFFIGMKINEV